MRPVTVPPPPEDLTDMALLARWFRDLANEIETASRDADVVDLATQFTVMGTLTETYSINLSSPTAANVAAVLATFLANMARGGSTLRTS